MAHGFCVYQWSEAIGAAELVWRAIDEALGVFSNRLHDFNSGRCSCVLRQRPGDIVRFAMDENPREYGHLIPAEQAQRMSMTA